MSVGARSAIDTRIDPPRLSFHLVRPVDGDVTALGVTQREGAEHARQCIGVENGADDVMPPSHPREVFAAAGMADKSYPRSDGADHDYRGQPGQLTQDIAAFEAWLASRNLA